MSKVISTGFILVISVLLMSASCRNSNGGEAETVESTIEGGVDGVVTMKYSGSGCALLISVDKDGNEVFYIPVELDEKFKSEGMKVSMTFHVSRINQGSCLVGTPIVIDKIQNR